MHVNTWSKNIQNKELLLATRAIMFEMDKSDIVVNEMGILNNSKVLDVGCGIGCFISYLSHSTKNVSYYGVDIDENFIRDALPVYKPNNANYHCCNAYELPFESNYFDNIVSCAFFNCVGYPDIALKEMVRVVKNNGTISTVMPLSAESTFFFNGSYPNECTWINDLRTLYIEYLKACEVVNSGFIGTSRGKTASEMPEFFLKEGLNDIKLYPMSYAFSLSDSKISKEDKLSIINNLYLGIIKKLHNNSNNNIFSRIFSVDKQELFDLFLTMHKDFLINNIDSNNYWEWCYGGSLLIVGKVSMKEGKQRE